MTAVHLTGAVMTHPKRAAAAEEIAAKDPRGRIRVVMDPDPSGPPTALRTATPSWNCVGDEATHHLVFQDDVLVAEGFFAAAEKIAAAAPGEAVAFYEGWEGRNSGVVRLGALVGASWAYAVDEHVPSLALMLPADVARGYADFAAKHGDGWPYDVVIQRYLKALGVPVRIAVPSIVDHDDVPSIAGNSTHGWRRATFFSGRAQAAAPVDGCAAFSVVPFYQYGESRCGVRHEERWEYMETARYLARTGLLDACDRDFAAAHGPDLPAAVCREVWLTAFATGAVFATSKAQDPDPAVARAVMESLGPGGLCEEYTGAELVPMMPPIRDLALTAFTAGRAAQRAAGSGARRPATVGVAVTGGDAAFGAQLAGLLVDAGCDATYAGRLGTGADRGASAVIHVGDPESAAGSLPELLAAAEKSGVQRLVYASSAAVYRGVRRQDCTEDALSAQPRDAQARFWWDEEQTCLCWGRETGTQVQIVRFAELVGPHAPLRGTLATWMLQAWTRRPMVLVEGRRHQTLDYRDMAGALAAILARPARSPVYNVASACYDEAEFAELAAETARRTQWEKEQATDQPHVPVMSTTLITAETGWRASASMRNAARAQAQWLACDTHGEIPGMARRRADA